MTPRLAGAPLEQGTCARCGAVRPERELIGVLVGRVFVDHCVDCAPAGGDSHEETIASERSLRYPER